MTQQIDKHPCIIVESTFAELTLLLCRTHTDSLEVLSIGRNQIKKLEGLEDVSATLKELWVSYNLIEKFNGIEKVQLPARHIAAKVQFVGSDIQHLSAAHQPDGPLLQQQPDCEMAGGGSIGTRPAAPARAGARRRRMTRARAQRELVKLEELLLVGNPLFEAHKPTEDVRIHVAGRLPWLKKLDGQPVDDDERERGTALVG